MVENQQQYEVNIQKANHVDSSKVVQERGEQTVKFKILKLQAIRRKWRTRKQRRRRSQACGQ